MNIDKLHPNVKEVLLTVHRKHTATMGSKEKEKHSLDNIKNIKVCKDHIKVYYRHGEWYHYTPSGTWY